MNMEMMIRLSGLPRFICISTMGGDYLDDHGAREKFWTGEKPGRGQALRTGDSGLMRREVTLEDFRRPFILKRWLAK